jgi:hypothetical protein
LFYKYFNHYVSDQLEIEEQNNNYSLIYKNSRPFFVHGPGNTEMFELLKKLHYNITEEQIARIKSKASNIYLNKGVYYGKEMFLNYYLIIVIIILIIFLYCNRKK